MQVEDYGLVFLVMEDVLDNKSIHGNIREDIHLLPVEYSTQKMIKYNTVLSINCHGETISDAGIIWEEDQESCEVRFDYYHNKGYQNRKHLIQNYSLNANIMKELALWTIKQLKENEQHDLIYHLQEAIVKERMRQSEYRRL